MTKQEKRDSILNGLVFALLTTGLLGLTLFSYILGVGDRSFMDVWGWVYYFVSSLMHAGFFVLAPLVVVYIPLSLLGVRKKIGIPVLGIFYVFLVLVAVVNRYVFQLYHFHINGFVLDMLFSEGAGEIFVFSVWLYVKAILIFLGVCLAVIVLAWLSSYLSRKIARRRPVYCYSLAAFLAISLLSQGFHVYGAATLHPSILESDSFLPYYFPLSMNSALDKMGIIDRTEIATLKISENSAPITYPVNELRTDANKLMFGHPNIVMIVVDSWNFRTLTEDCMPNVWSFKEKAEFFSNHLSSSNGTRGGIFGLITGLTSYYWKSFEYSSLRPVFIRQLQENGYAIQVYPSANFRTPPFDRMFFKGMDIHTTTEGNSVYERDCNLTSNFINDLADFHRDGLPFFSLLFYDMAHAIAVPKERNTRFQPAWEYADYTKLNNNTDPLPYYNLYRNCLYQIDSLVGMVFKALEANNLMDNTIIVVTGDHGQEFNENKKNYWGHSGNYSRYQIQVPLILYYPQVQKKVYCHRTTHYDIVPTLSRMAFGISNPASDYSMGEFLQNDRSRGWHIVGNDINYAFITEDGHIIEKQGNGYVKVYDRDMNLQSNYKISPKELNDNLVRLNRFYR
ncbi:MAG: sulfatase-like hydrolase/transferase [bacterium]